MAGTQKPCVSMVAAEEGGIRVKNDAGKEHLAFTVLGLSRVLKKHDLNHLADNFVGKAGIRFNSGMRRAKADGFPDDGAAMDMWHQACVKALASRQPVAP